MFGREFIESVVELAKNEVINHNNVDYSTRRLYKIEKPLAAKLNGNSLDGLINFVKGALQLELAYPLVIAASHDGVDVHSQLTKNLDRDFLFRATPLTPSLDLGRWNSVEDFIIKLQTCYEDTDNRTKLLTMSRKFMSKDTLEIKDNGIGQEVVINQGVVIGDPVEIQPIIALQPKRTFGEVDQVESLFLFRARKDTSVCIFEADGGSWKDLARQNVVDYLQTALSAEITDGLVSVI